MTFDEAKKCKEGQRVRFVCGGPDNGDEGTIAEVYATGFNVKWDDGNEIGYAFSRGDYHFRNLKIITARMRSRAS